MAVDPRTNDRHVGPGASRRARRVKRSLVLSPRFKVRRWLGTHRLLPPDGVPDHRQRRHLDGRGRGQRGQRRRRQDQMARGRGQRGQRRRRQDQTARRQGQQGQRDQRDQRDQRGQRGQRGQPVRRRGRSLLRRLGLSALRNLTSAGVDLSRASADAAAQLDKLRRRLLPTERPPTSGPPTSQRTFRWRARTEPALRGSTEMKARGAVTGDYVYDYYQWEYEYHHLPVVTTERPVVEERSTVSTPPPSPPTTLSPNGTVMLQRFEEYAPNRTEAGRRVAALLWSHWLQLKPHCVRAYNASDGYGVLIRRASCSAVLLAFGEGDWPALKLLLKTILGPVFTVIVFMVVAWLMCGACNICQFCPCAWCNPSQLREAICDLINRAMPGLRLYKDGTMEMYVPSTEETDAFQDLVDAIMDFK